MTHDQQIEKVPTASALTVQGLNEARRGIYIASKTKHAGRWRSLRDSGVPLISTWIDEAGEGESKDLHDLWRRCLSEASSCQVLIAYREKDEVFKGSWVEIGAALSAGVPVYAVGLDEFTIAKYHGVTQFSDMDSAITSAREVLRNEFSSPAVRDAEARLREALEQRDRDIGILLSNIRFLEDCLGESLGDEDAAMIRQIEREHEDRNALSPAGGDGTKKSEGGVDNDCEDQGLCATDVCTKFECQTWDDNIQIRPRLILRGKYWVCPKCHSSYGADAKGVTTKSDVGAALKSAQHNSLQVHDWIVSTFGQETMCARCRITKREAVEFGRLNECVIPLTK